MAVKKKTYSGLHLFVDICLVMLTGGFWLLWIVIRTLRANQ